MSSPADLEAMDHSLARKIFSQSAIVGTYHTRQAISLDGETSESIVVEAIWGALANAGVSASQVDGLAVDVLERGKSSSYFVPFFGGRSCWTLNAHFSGVSAVAEAAMAIAAGLCRVVVVAVGQAGMHRRRETTAPWTITQAPFMAPFGVYTAVEYALMARRHMHLYGTTRLQMAEVAATIRNHGHANPDAIYFGRGPFTPEDILNSRPICDPFNLLDCSATSEGGSALVMVHRDLLADLDATPAFVLGAGVEAAAQGYTRPPVWEDFGQVGRRAAQRSFAIAGLKPNDVDVCEIYDCFSWEIIRQFEAYGFCAEGEGGAFVMDGRIGMGGQFPTATNGGTMSFSHPGSAQMLQKVIQAARQVQGSAGAGQQVADARVSIASNAGSASLMNDVMLLGGEPLE